MYIVIIDAAGSVHLDLDSFLAGQNGYRVALSTGNIEEALHFIAGKIPRQIVIATDHPKGLSEGSAIKKPMPPHKPRLLSARETEILALLNQGYTKESVANRLCLSYHTVKTHTTNIYKKLNVRSCREATFKFFREGID